MTGRLTVLAGKESELKECGQPEQKLTPVNTEGRPNRKKVTPYIDAWVIVAALAGQRFLL